MPGAEWPQFPKTTYLEMRKPDWDLVHSHREAERLRFEHLTPDQVQRICEIGLPNLRALSLRFLRAPDLQLLRWFPSVKQLEVWQSNKVTSFSGLEHLPDLNWLCLSELGPLPTLEPLRNCTKLESFALTGGFWKNQMLEGSLAPVAAFRRLRHLMLYGLRGPSDLGPFLDFPELEYLYLPPAPFALEEVARVAARYPFYAAARPWLVEFEQDSEGCSRCGRKADIAVSHAQTTFLVQTLRCRKAPENPQ
ncbi:MAG: hypothetical protein IPJ98_14940 [Bryobacterales bacterium]|nr:hypothetical protein [Bryobacterales bacterium]